MDKDAALLVVAKDLFLQSSSENAGFRKKSDRNQELERFAEEYLAFYNKLKSGIAG